MPANLTIRVSDFGPVFYTNGHCDSAARLFARVARKLAALGIKLPEDRLLRQVTIERIAESGDYCFLEEYAGDDDPEAVAFVQEIIDRCVAEAEDFIAQMPRPRRRDYLVRQRPWETVEPPPSIQEIEARAAVVVKRPPRRPVRRSPARRSPVRRPSSSRRRRTSTPTRGDPSGSAEPDELAAHAAPQLGRAA